MKVTLKQIGENGYFEGYTEEGLSIRTHATIVEGEEKKAPTPMEALLIAAAGCSAVDTILILRKMNQKLVNLEVKIDAERVPKKSSKPFDSIQLHFLLTGDLNEKKAERAVKLAVEKYCSVIDSLNDSIKIDWSIEINS